MLKESEQKDIFEEVKSRLNLTNVNLELYDKIEIEKMVIKEMGDLKGDHILPRIVMDGTLEKIVVGFERDAMKYYNEKELTGHFLASLCGIKIRRDGYKDIIREGAKRAVYDFPEMIQLVPHIGGAFENSSSIQIGIDNGFLEESYSHDMKNMKAITNMIEGSGGYGPLVGNWKDKPDHINIITNSASPPYFATDNINYGQKIDGLTKKMLAKMPIDEKALGSYDKFVELLTVKNPPTKTKITRNVLNIMQLYSQFI